MGLASSCQGDIKENETYAYVQRGQDNKIQVKIDQKPQPANSSQIIQKQQQQIQNSLKQQQFQQKSNENYNNSIPSKNITNNNNTLSNIKPQITQNNTLQNQNKPSNILQNQNPNQTQRNSENKMSFIDQQFQNIQIDTQNTQNNNQNKNIYQQQYEQYIIQNPNKYLDQNLPTQKPMVQQFQQRQSEHLLTSQRTSKVVSTQIVIENSDQKNEMQNQSFLNMSYITTSQQQQNEEDMYEKDIPYFAKEIYEDGSVYEGYKLNGKRQGKGTFKYSQGGRYVGDWDQNRICGKGTLYYPNDEKAYEGEWKDDQFNGQGIVYNEIQNQSINDVEFDYKNFDALDQQWVKYDGEFRKDFKDGLGTLYLSNNEKYTGKFSFDYVHGKGSYYTRNGQKILGEWRINKLIEVFK